VFQIDPGQVGGQLVQEPVHPGRGRPELRLSRLESGERRPSLDLLLRLARTYRVTLDELVDAPDTGDPRIHARPSVRYGVTWVPLTRRAGGLQAFKLVIPGGFPAGEPEQRSHEGYEWMYVLDGRLRLLLGGHELVLISAQGQRAHVRARPARSAPNPTGRA